MVLEIYYGKYPSVLIPDYEFGELYIIQKWLIEAAHSINEHVLMNQKKWNKVYETNVIIPKV